MKKVHTAQIAVRLRARPMTMARVAVVTGLASSLVGCRAHGPTALGQRENAVHVAVRGNEDPRRAAEVEQMLIPVADTVGLGARRRRSPTISGVRCFSRPPKAAHDGEKAAPATGGCFWDQVVSGEKDLADLDAKTFDNPESPIAKWPGAKFRSAVINDEKNHVSYVTWVLVEPVAAKTQAQPTTVPEDDSK